MISLNKCFLLGYNQMQSITEKHYKTALKEFFDNCNWLVNKNKDELLEYFDNEYEDGISEYLLDYFYSELVNSMENDSFNTTALYIDEYDNVYSIGWETFHNGVEIFLSIWLKDPINVNNMSNYFVENIKDIVG